MAFNIVAQKDPSPERIFNVFGSANVYVEDSRSVSDEMIEDKFNKQHSADKKAYFAGKLKGRSEMGAGHNVWGTAISEPLSDKQYNGLFDGSTKVYVVSWGAWEDGKEMRAPHLVAGGYRYCPTSNLYLIATLYGIVAAAENLENRISQPISQYPQSTKASARHLSHDTKVSQTVS